MALRRLSFLMILVVFVPLAVLGFNLYNLSMHSLDSLAQNHATILEARTALQQGTALWFGIAALLALVIGFQVRRLILRPLNLMVYDAEKVAAGDLSQRLQIPVTLAEYERVVDASNRMIESVSQRLIDAENARQQLQQIDEYRLNLLHEITEALLEPIQNISTHSQILEQDAHGMLNEAQRRSVMSIRRTIANEQSLVADLMEFAHVQKKGLRLSMERLRLPDVVDQVYKKAIVDHYSDKEISFLAEFPDDLPRIVGDPRRVEQVVERLLEWAFDLSVKNGRVSLSAQMCDNAVQITITDMIAELPDGMPSSVSHLHLVPDRHVVQAPTSARAGLGLTFARTLIEHQGGTLDIDQRPGIGNTFVFTLPAAQMHRKAA